MTTMKRLRLVTAWMLPWVVNGTAPAQDRPAQPPDRPPTRKPDQPPAQPPRKPDQPPTGPDRRVDLAWSQPASRWERSSTLIGRRITNDRSEDLGRVHDFIVGPSGRLTYVIIESDGRYAAVPYDAASFPTSSDRYMLPYARDYLFARSFTNDRWPDFSNRGWAEQTYTYYNRRPYWQQDNPPSGAPVVTTGDNPDWYRFPDRWDRASDLIRHQIRSAQDEEMGDVEDLVIDPDRGRILYGVMSRGVDRGPDSKLYPVPWSAFRNSPNDPSRYMLDIDRTRLNTASGFERQHWPNMTDEAWSTDLHSYYGRPPYWRDRGGIVTQRPQDSPQNPPRDAKKHDDSP